MVHRRQNYFYQELVDLVLAPRASFRSASYAQYTGYPYGKGKAPPPPPVVTKG
jgi:hypothetical protein